MGAPLASSSDEPALLLIGARGRADFPLGIVMMLFSDLERGSDRLVGACRCVFFGTIAPKAWGALAK
jgi:hypothetical protein